MKNCMSVFCAEGSSHLGPWMIVKLDEGKAEEIQPELHALIHREDDDEITEKIKDLVLEMICVEATDRYKMSKVCQQLNSIERYLS